MSTACHWCLIASPHTYEITGTLFSCPLIYFRLVLCSHCKLWLVQCLLQGFLTPRKQQQHRGHLEFVRNSGPQAPTGPWNQSLHFDKIHGESACTCLLSGHFPPSHAMDSRFSTTFSCTRGMNPFISIVHSSWPYSCLLFSNGIDFLNLV